MGQNHERELAFDIWDWTLPCQQLSLFQQWSKDLKRAGFNVIEITAPWSKLEPRPHQYDFSFVSQRLAITKKLGMYLRVRINTYYASAMPAWLKCDLWCDHTGKVVMPIPSINDNRFWECFLPLCTMLARQFHNEPVQFSPFIGVHGELKWSDWWSYDPASVNKWRQSISIPRPAWLKRIAGNANLPQQPPVLPNHTNGEPDLSPSHRAFIAFREHSWRDAVYRFVQAIREGNPRAFISVPLGEGYRSASATMSNSDYFGLSRGANHIVHSYDFFWHAKDPVWHAAASVAALQGITGLPVSFEIDGPILQEKFGYTDAQILRVLGAALAEGAHLKIANYSYSDKLPSEHRLVTEAAKIAQNVTTSRRTDSANTVLLFVSKWTNYCYREQTEWLHDAQFGAWHMLTQHGYPVRVVCEDNLQENLGDYKGIYVAFSPMETLPLEDRKRLEEVAAILPSVVEVVNTPHAGNDRGYTVQTPSGEIPVTHSDLPILPTDLSSLGKQWTYLATLGSTRLIAHREKRAVIGFPLAFLWLRHKKTPALVHFVEWLLRSTLG